MQWSKYILYMCSKANKSFNFLRCNLRKCSSDVKKNAYVAFERPH